MNPINVAMSLTGGINTKRSHLPESDGLLFVFRFRERSDFFRSSSIAFLLPAAVEQSG